MAAAGDEMENEATSALAIAADSAAAESTEGNVDATAQPQKVESSFKKLVNYHKRVEYFTACSRATEYAADALDGTTAVEFLKAHNKLGPKGKLTQLKGLSEAYQASLESEYKTESEREAAKAVVSFSVVDKNVGITRKVFHCWSALHANEPPTDNIEAMWTWALEETGGLDSRRAFEALISLCREGTAAGSISTRFLKHYQERQRRALETAAERFAHSDNRSDERSAASDRSESMSVSDELDEPPTAAADSTGHVGDNEDHNSSTLDDETSVAVGEGAPPAVGEEVAPPAARPAASGRGGDGGNRLPSSQANKPPSDPGLGPNEPDPTTEANEGDAPLAGITHPPGDTGERGDRFASGQTNKSSEANPSGSTTVEEGVGAPPDAAAAVLARDGGDGGARNAASQGNNPPGEEPVVPALANIEPAVATPTQGSGSNRTRSASVADDEGAPPEGPTDRSGRGREGGDRRGTSQANKSSEAHPSGLTSVEGEVVATPVGTTDPPGDSGERGDRFASSQTNKSSEANPPGSTSVEEGAGALQEAAAAVPARDGGEGGARNPASQGNNPSVEESVVRQLANMETPALSRRQGLRSSRSRSKSESVAEGAGPDASAAPPRDRDSVEGGDPNTSSQANKHPGEQQEVREQAANETTPTQGLGSNRSRSTSESVEAATAAQARESDSEGGEDPRQPSKPSGLRGSSRFVSPPPHLANVETPDSSEGVATRSKKRGSSAIATEPVKRRRAATESPMAASADTCDEHTVQGRVPNPSAPRKSRPPTHQESPSPSQPAHSRRSSPRKLGSHVGTNRGWSSVSTSTGGAGRQGSKRAAKSATLSRAKRTLTHGNGRGDFARGRGQTQDDSTGEGHATSEDESSSDNEAEALRVQAEEGNDEAEHLQGEGLRLGDDDGSDAENDQDLTSVSEDDAASGESSVRGNQGLDDVLNDLESASGDETALHYEAGETALGVQAEEGQGNDEADLLRNADEDGSDVEVDHASRSVVEQDAASHESVVRGNQGLDDVRNDRDSASGNGTALDRVATATALSRVAEGGHENGDSNFSVEFHRDDGLSISFLSEDKQVRLMNDGAWADVPFRRWYYCRSSKSATLLVQEDAVLKELALGDVVPPLNRNEADDYDILYDGIGYEHEQRMAAFEDGHLSRGTFLGFTDKTNNSLDEQVVQYYFTLLMKRDDELCELDSTRKSSFFFSPSFFGALMDGRTDLGGSYDYNHVKNHAELPSLLDAGIISFDKIFFPVNNGQRWGVVVVFLQEERMLLYDSTVWSMPRAEWCAKNVFRFLQDFCHHTNMPHPDLTSWTFYMNRTSQQQQENDLQSGIFMCMFANFMSVDRPFCIGEEHIAACRKRMAYDILKAKAFRRTN